jgi:hypothetical protein
VLVEGLNLDTLQIVGVSNTNVVIRDTTIHVGGLALMHQNRYGAQLATS